MIIHGSFVYIVLEVHFEGSSTTLGRSDKDDNTIVDGEVYISGVESTSKLPVRCKRAVAMPRAVAGSKLRTEEVETTRILSIDEVGDEFFMCVMAF